MYVTYYLNIIYYDESLKTTEFIYKDFLYWHDDDDMVLYHIFPVFTGLGQCLIFN